VAAAVSAPLPHSEWDTPKRASCASVEYVTITTHRCGGAPVCRLQMLRRGRGGDVYYRILCLSVGARARARMGVNVYVYVSFWYVCVCVSVNMCAFVCVPSTTTITAAAAATITARRACWPIDKHRRTDAPKAPSVRVYRYTLILCTYTAAAMRT